MGCIKDKAKESKAQRAMRVAETENGRRFAGRSITSKKFKDTKHKVKYEDLDESCRSLEEYEGDVIAELVRETGISVRRAGEYADKYVDTVNMHWEDGIEPADCASAIIEAEGAGDVREFVRESYEEQREFNKIYDLKQEALELLAGRPAIDFDFYIEEYGLDMDEWYANWGISIDEMTNKEFIDYVSQEAPNQQALDILEAIIDDNQEMSLSEAYEYVKSRGYKLRLAEDFTSTFLMEGTIEGMAALLLQTLNVKSMDDDNADEHWVECELKDKLPTRLKNEIDRLVTDYLNSANDSSIVDYENNSDLETKSYRIIFDSHKDSRRFIGDIVKFADGNLRRYPVSMEYIG